MSSTKLPYALAREIDDFCRGSAPDGTEFWVQVAGEPEITDKHMTSVPVRLAQMTPEGLETLGRYTIKTWPSVLDEFDTELMKFPGERHDWVKVVYECTAHASGKVSRRMKVHDTRDAHISGPSKPGAGDGVSGSADNPTTAPSPAEPLPGHVSQVCTCPPMERVCQETPRGVICLRCGGWV